MSSMKNDSLFSVAGKVVLVTGGSRGLGEYMARGYVENGAKVYISSRKAEVCERLAAELSKHGTCIALPADLGKMEEVERLAAELGKREAKLHVLMNNAGNTWGAPIETFPESGWDRVMNLNVKSLFFLTQKLLPQLSAAADDADWARVINIASVEGLHASSLDAVSYSTSKGAVVHLTKVMAKKLAKHRIAVNAIAPGYFPSKMTADLPAEVGDEVKRQTPMGRWGTPEDIAGLALFLSSRAGSYLTGAIIPIDGGLATTA